MNSLITYIIMYGIINHETDPCSAVWPRAKLGCGSDGSAGPAPSAALACLMNAYFSGLELGWEWGWWWFMLGGWCD